MKFEVSLFTAIIVLIVGLYDMAYAFNRRYKNNGRSFGPFMILGIIFTIFGIYLLVRHWMG